MFWLLWQRKFLGPFSLNILPKHVYVDFCCISYRKDTKTALLGPGYSRHLSLMKSLVKDLLSFRVHIN